MRILVTGAAGFIGAHLCKLLQEQGIEVLGIDNFNDYYSPDLKMSRIENLVKKPHETILKIDLLDKTALKNLFEQYKPNVVVHLAAQAGVRLKDSEFYKYTDSNIIGFANICELIKEFEITNFLYASSSSVYGNLNQVPFKESSSGLQPISVYGVTKLFDELYGFAYFRNTQIKSVGMRFFTVYGPWGRPDMAYFKIINSLLNKTEFTRFGNGELKRDFTYVEDTVNSIYKLIMKVFESKIHGQEIYNVGGGNPYSLNELINEMERQFAQKLVIKELDASSADVKITYASYEKLQNYINYAPKTTLKEGISNLLAWVKNPGVTEKILNWSN